MRNSEKISKKNPRSMSIERGFFLVRISS